MDLQLNDVFSRYNEYVTRLRHDLAPIKDTMPAERRDAFDIPEYDFATFCERWHLIARNGWLLQRWMRRLSTTGYDDERSQIRAAINKIPQMSSSRKDSAA